MVDKWLELTRRILYPPTCLLCGAPGRGDLDLCAGCRADLPANRPACPRCGCTLPQPLDASMVCGRCLLHPPAFDRLLAPCRYEPPADHLLHALKFGGRLVHARLLGQLMAEHVACNLSDPPDRIVPVPLHPRRLRERGFNQALELARPIARRLAIPLDVASCARVRATLAQSTLPAERRGANVRGAFRVLRPWTARRVAVVDDVVTTGSTVEEFARTLRQAGAEHVEVWAWARVTR